MENNNQINNKNDKVNSDVDKNVFASKIVEQRKKPDRFIYGNTSYIDAESLNNQSKISLANNKWFKTIIVAAAIIAFICFIYFFINIFGKSVAMEEKMESILSVKKDYSLPKLTGYLDMSNEEIYEAIKSDNKYVVLEQDNKKGTLDVLDFYKVPDGVDPANAEKILNKGFKNMNATEAATIFNGGWQLTCDSSKNRYLRVRYADFSGKSIEECISDAIKSQAFVDSYTDKTDKDEMGNTYATGTADYNGKKVSWRVSVLPMSEAYNVGLPESTNYVGIRVEYL